MCRQTMSPSGSGRISDSLAPLWYSGRNRRHVVHLSRTGRDWWMRSVTWCDSGHLEVSVNEIRYGCSACFHAEPVWNVTWPPGDDAQGEQMTQWRKVKSLKGGSDTRLSPRLLDRSSSPVWNRESEPKVLPPNLILESVFVKSVHRVDIDTSPPQCGESTKNKLWRSSSSLGFARNAVFL